MSSVTRRAITAVTVGAALAAGAAAPALAVTGGEQPRGHRLPLPNTAASALDVDQAQRLLADQRRLSVVAPVLGQRSRHPAGHGADLLGSTEALPLPGQLSQLGGVLRGQVDLRRPGWLGGVRRLADVAGRRHR